MSIQTNGPDPRPSRRRRKKQKPFWKPRHNASPPDFRIRSQDRARGSFQRFIALFSRRELPWIERETALNMMLITQETSYPVLDLLIYSGSLPPEWEEVSPEWQDLETRVKGLATFIRSLAEDIIFYMGQKRAQYSFPMKQSDSHVRSFLTEVRSFQFPAFENPVLEQALLIDIPREVDYVFNHFMLTGWTEGLLGIWKIREQQILLEHIVRCVESIAKEFARFVVAVKRVISEKDPELGCFELASGILSD